MRTQTKKDLAEIREQEELLKGNINRMCVTDSLEELVSMKNFAEFRIARIFAINFDKLKGSEDCENAETE